MTREHKRAVKKALRAYADGGPGGPAGRKWRAAIGRALAYYDASPAVAGLGRLLRLRYIAGWTEPDTIEALGIGRTTYIKWQMDALSTVGVYAAEAGLLGSGTHQGASLPGGPE